MSNLSLVKIVYKDKKTTDNIAREEIFEIQPLKGSRGVIGVNGEIRLAGTVWALNMKSGQ